MLYDNIGDDYGQGAEPGAYQDDDWGRPWGHPDYGKDPEDPDQDLQYPAQVAAPAPTAIVDDPEPEPEGGSGDAGGGTGGDTGAGAGGSTGGAVPSMLSDWFLAHPPPDGFGAAPAPFGETFTQLARPEHLAQPYVAPEWTETFAEPELPAHLQAPFTGPQRPDALNTAWTPPDWQTFLQDNGVQAALKASQKGFERSAASKGSILSGGSQIALGRELQGLTANQYGAATNRSLTQRQQLETEYGNQYGQELGTRNQQMGEFQQGRSNAFANYQERYGAFTGNRDAGIQARNTNENAYQNDVGNNLNQYNTRYNSYLNAIQGKRQSETDWWQRGMDLSRLGLEATTAGGGG